MTEDVIIVPIIFGLPTIAVIVRMLLRHREKMVELHRNAAASNPAIEERLSRVEHALDAIAIEMERVGEGQRFLTKVFTQRDDSGATPLIGATDRSTPSRNVAAGDG